jgi:hypothetical protein
MRRSFLKKLAAVPLFATTAGVPAVGTSPKIKNPEGEWTKPMTNVNGVSLCYEVTGDGAPLVWVHEYGGDLRSWEAQVRYFSRRYRVVTYNQRGYSPSTIPKTAHEYSQELLVEDLHQFLTYLRPWPCPSWRLLDGGERRA